MDTGPSAEKDREEVWAASEQMIRHEMARDFETVASIYAPDAVIQAANLPAMVGRPDILQGYRDFFAELLEIEGRPTEVVVAASGDVAFEYGTNRFVWKTPEGPQEVIGKYSRGWKKIDGGWMIQLQTYSPDV